MEQFIATGMNQTFSVNVNNGAFTISLQMVSDWANAGYNFNNPVNPVACELYYNSVKVASVHPKYRDFTLTGPTDNYQLPGGDI